jgi:CO/xanthine dehydrogenase FAD-binding subunit
MNAELLLPRTMSEVDALAPVTALLAGGTDLLVRRRAELPAGPLSDGGPMADITRLTDAPAAVAEVGSALRLSALAPIAMIARDLGDRLAGLRAAISCFASPQIRNRATLGGNLANASPAADCVPPLVAAGAVAWLRGPGGRRAVPVAELATGPRRTCLAPAEWIEAVDVVPRSGAVPPADGVPEEGFRKIAGRQALAISIASLAWSWLRRPDGSLSAVRLAAGAVAPVVIRCPRAERALEGRAPTPGVLAEALRALDDDIRPIDDLRGSAGYRRAALAGALTEAASPPERHYHPRRLI